MGTPAYMAPEQALATDVGPPADLYAVGVLAYEMFAGNVPFHGSDVPMAIMLQHLNEPVPPLGDQAARSRSRRVRVGRADAREGTRGPPAARPRRATSWTSS